MNINGEKKNICMEISHGLFQDTAPALTWKTGKSGRFLANKLPHQTLVLVKSTIKEIASIWYIP